MDKVRKLFLVDPDQINKFAHQSTDNIASRQLSALDNEMKTILENTQLSDDAKWSVYNQVLQRYLHLVRHLNQTVEIPIVDEAFVDAETTHIPPSPVLKGAILQSVPPASRLRAELLYDKLIDSKKISWDESGKVNIADKTIQGSNIIDLISDLVRNRAASNPAGWLEMSHLIAQLNIPHELLANTRRRDYINQLARATRNHLN